MLPHHIRPRHDIAFCREFGILSDIPVLLMKPSRILLIFALCLLPLPAAAGFFEDVPDTYPYAPSIEYLRKHEIIREGSRLGVDYSLTVSCYDPDGSGRACGRCDSCRLRAQGFAEAGVADPTRYR